MKERLPFSAYFVIGFMLFALFFGAGNLIFPATLGQNAGTNFWPAVGGLLITGIGLPFLGILAMGFSGSENLQVLASRVHPIYAVIFTVLLYFTIGPFFAAPRTGAVAYEIGIAPFVGAESAQIGMFLFTLLFFGVTLGFSLYPTKIVDIVGKILSPAIILLLLVLLITVVVNPLGPLQAPQGEYANSPFPQGFIEGYNTMDALSSLVFGIIVINVIRNMGVTSKKGILAAAAKTGFVSIIFLGVIYIGIAYVGAVVTEKFGYFETGGPLLSQATSYYFGTLGAILLAVIIILACLTTSIGLITACGEYLHTLIPRISYKVFAVFFSLLSFIIANFGLENIIKYSVPVLMFLYPLAIVLMILTFVSPLIRDSRFVYQSTIAITFLISSIDGLKTYCKQLERPYYEWMSPIVSFYEQYLPFYKAGLGWLVPAMIMILLTGVVSRLKMR
ncbi:branched-chain amino acid transport system II carrier protein [Lederbergia sp. NSJ-179]|uniref:branched-chain amino acid transport system II carrier protein n=1 Tax=Lederbergia sp. NSJ-179 TaxID=2931402 RepID=UPI001FD1ABF6|nr:branched-chain amino acid transport system II carrier protein [Lederbergia sp. NSJ-179]MCJ7840076.1 branched-chain amino acid transport system II carrier protein [Lederbergia sp. NSJ-179]